MQILLQGTKRIYSDGLNVVFLKPGGRAKALEDFDRVNTARRIKDVPSADKIYVCFPYLYFTDITN